MNPSSTPPSPVRPQLDPTHRHTWEPAEWPRHFQCTCGASCVRDQRGQMVAYAAGRRAGYSTGPAWQGGAS